MKRTVAIVGAGPAALMLAASLDSSRYNVTIYERNNSAGRKFLVAGDGGLNITHSEDSSLFLKRYTPSGFLEEPFSQFNNQDLVRWLADAGVPTFTGSSGRVFPEKKLKPIDVLNRILQRVSMNNVVINYKHEWVDFEDKSGLRFRFQNKEIAVWPDITVFALGGASWPVTGSTGEWLEVFSRKGILTRDFSSSNCAMTVEWPAVFSEIAQGSPLKNISIRCGEATVKGEVVITSKGLEGSGIYPLSPAIRVQLNRSGFAEIWIDLKPAWLPEKVHKVLSEKGAGTLTEHLKSGLGLSKIAVSLLKTSTSRESFTDVSSLAGLIKNLPLRITGFGPLSEAISSTGGVALEAIDSDFMLKDLKHCYAIGEMLDYDAPTGGYLLQSCFTMGYYLAHQLNKC